MFCELGSVVANLVPLCSRMNPDVGLHREPQTLTWQEPRRNKHALRVIFPGSLEPQTLQNQVSHSESGFAHWTMFSWPWIHLKL